LTRYDPVRPSRLEGRARGTAEPWSPGREVSGRLRSALPAPNPAIQALLAAYRRLLEEHLGERVVQLTLFGPYARGDARENSDVDVAVGLGRIERLADRTLPMELAGDIIVEYGLALTPQVLSVSELAFLREREELLVANLDRQAIAV
jgi:predicted nucleotidyltransferase